MNSVQVSKTQFSSELAGSALLIPPQVISSTFSGTISGGSQTRTFFVPYSDQRYFSSAIWNLTGPSSIDFQVWNRAPRSVYLMSEPTFPTPRIYISKKNTSTGVHVQMFITNATGTSFTLSGIHVVNVHVYIFGSNQAY